MYYSIRHVTRFRYSAPISESMMEVRMRPRTEGTQRCLDFSLQTAPRTHTTWYRDYLGNMVYHFDIPGRHTQLTITAESLVELTPPPVLPEALPSTAWDELDAAIQLGDFWDMLMPSHFARATPLLDELARELDVQRRADPLSLLRELNARIYAAFAYMPQITEVDSPIDDALKRRQGVCQDFSHVMITLVREWLRIPCRYVSGYLFHRSEDHDRSEQDATHAWVEVFLPDLGWVGFDPTNNLIAAERHIRTAVGRDYADVPPTRGVFKGQASTELDVGVQVTPTEAPPPDEELLPPIEWNPVEVSAQEELQPQHQQDQDQQQQQQQ
jgi:transglutaminase-like putative cysteine protease